MDIDCSPMNFSTGLRHCQGLIPLRDISQIMPPNASNPGLFCPWKYAAQNLLQDTCFVRGLAYSLCCSRGYVPRAISPLPPDLSTLVLLPFWLYDWCKVTVGTHCCATLTLDHISATVYLSGVVWRTRLKRQGTQNITPFCLLLCW